jgi:hypothetical protein
MNKIIIGLITIVALILGFLGGYKLNKSNAPEVVQTENSSVINNEVAVEKTDSKNKFFELFNNFTREQDMSAPKILFSDVKNKLIAFYYPTSQESNDEGVYDYKNNIIYNKLTNATNDSENYSTIFAFIDANTILVNIVENGKAKLVAMDFKTKKIVKSVNVDLTEGQYMNALSHYPYGNKIMIGIYSPPHPEDEYNYPMSYVLNTDSFTLTPSKEAQ